MRKQIRKPVLSALGCFLSLFLLHVCEGSLSPTVLPTSARSAVNNINAYAGTGTASSTGTGGSALSATMNAPRNVWQDTVGVTYFTEHSGNCVRKIDTSGIVFAFAGSCSITGSFSGDGGPATSALMNIPVQIFVSTVGATFISDFNNNRVRKVSAAGIITTYAGTGSTTNSGNGGAATAGGIYQCNGLWLNTVGVLYVTSIYSNQIRSVSVDGILSLFVGTGVGAYSGDGGPATSAMIYSAEKLTGDTTGVVYFSDSDNKRVRSVSTAGIVNLVMGTTGSSWLGENTPATSTGLTYPSDMWKDSVNGDFYVSNRNAHRVVVLTASTGLVSTFAGNGSPSSSGDGGAATSASVYLPDGLYLTTTGVLYMVEVYGNKIRQIYSVAPTGAPSVTPTMAPSVAPTVQPSLVPTVRPTILPSVSPTVAPSIAPTVGPTIGPTVMPSVVPSLSPTVVPSLNPSVKPTLVDLPIRDSPSYKVSNALAFAGITSGGGVMSWGAACCGGDSSSVSGLLDSDVMEVVQSRNAFAALKSDGSVVAWGAADDVSGSNSFQTYTTIMSLVATERAFTGVTSDGGVIAFGADCCGGNVDQYGWAQYLTSDVSSVRASAGAVCALKSDGTVYCWGSKFTGGGVSSLTRSDLSGIVMLSSTRSAFAGMTSDGSVVVWGNTAFGGSMSSAIKAKLATTTQFVVSGNMAFVAYTSSGDVVSWGNPEGGRDADGVGGFTLVAHTAYAFVVIRSNGTAVSWGSAKRGGDSSTVASSLVNVSYVVGNSGAFAAVTSAGEVVAWGDNESGGRLLANVSSAIGSDVTEIYHTSRAFAVVNGSGAVTAWGNEGRGGSIGSTIVNDLSSNVKLLCANDNAFTAIKNDGTAYGWGNSHSVQAGLISGDYSMIVSC